MAIESCPECHSEISSRAVACPKCGFPLAKAKSEKALTYGCLIPIMAALLVWFIFHISRADTPPNTAPPFVNKPAHEFSILERKMLNQALVLSVVTAEPLEQLSRKDLREIANYLVIRNSPRDMVRVFFYNSGMKPGHDAALCRFEWTPQQGLVMNYDHSPKPK